MNRCLKCGSLLIYQREKVSIESRNVSEDGIVLPEYSLEHTDDLTGCEWLKCSNLDCQEEYNFNEMDKKSNKEFWDQVSLDFKYVR